jgi:hypothetical protein
MEGALTQRPEPLFDPITDRPIHRLSTIVATGAETPDPLEAIGGPPGEFLRLGRLGAFYARSERQLPRVMLREAIDVTGLKFRRWTQPASAVRQAFVWAFDVPAGPIVMVFTIDVSYDLLELIPLLEDCYYDDITIANETVADTVEVLLQNAAPTVGRLSLRADDQRHQFVFTSGAAASASDDLLQRLIYRADLGWRPEHSSICFPGELNRRPTSRAAMGAFVSVLAGQQDYIENCALLSAVQIVSAMAKVRDIRADAYASLIDLRQLSSDRSGMRTGDRRAALTQIADAAARQELQLTFGVETAQEIGILVPSLRVDEYHRQLAECTGLGDNIRTVSGMLARLSSVITNEKASQDAYDARREDLRRLRWGIAVGILSVVAVPIGIILGYFGGNYPEVDPRASMFSWHHYHDLYLTVFGIIAVSAAIFILLLFRERRELRGLVR